MTGRDHGAPPPKPLSMSTCTSPPPRFIGLIGTWLLEQMKPMLALIPAGQGNSYGHPDQRTPRRLEGAGAGILRTDQDGDLRVWSDGAAVEWEMGR